MENNTNSTGVENVSLNQQETQGLIPAGQVFSQAFSIYREHVSHITSIFMLPAIFLGFASLFLRYRFVGAITLGWILSLVGVIFILASVAELLISIKENFSSDRSVTESYQVGMSFVLSLIWVGLLAGLVSLGGILLFVLPGIMLAVSLSFSQYVVVLDERRGLAALGLSWHYVRGRWWKVLWRCFFIACVTLLTSLALSLIFSVFHSKAIKEALTQFVSALVINPLSAIFMALVFQTLKASKTPPSGAEEASYRKKLTIFAILGPIALVLLLVAFGVLLGILLAYFLKHSPPGQAMIVEGLSANVFQIFR